MSLNSRRQFLALASVALLAACEAGPQVDGRIASTLSVVQVTANTTVSRSETALPKQQIVETARRKLESVLVGANPAGTRKVRVEMTVKQFYIANAVAGALLGSSVSSINTELTLVDAVTGDVIKGPFHVNGVTEPRPTILGAAAIKAPEVELDTITTDLARKARVAIFGR